MKAVVIHKPGAPEELVMAEVPEPSPGAGEVLVDVAFAGCNWADTQIRTGVYPHPSILVDKTGSVVGKFGKCTCRGMPITDQITHSNIWRSGISNLATWAFQFGVPSAAISACAFAMIAVGPKRIASWGSKQSS